MTLELVSLENFPYHSCLKTPWTDSLGQISSESVLVNYLGTHSQFPEEHIFS